MFPFPNSSQFKQKMFLNLHRDRTDKRLTLDYKPLREKTYLNSFEAKEKSYSTGSLKKQFEIFKNKSISSNNNISLHHSIINRQHCNPRSQYTSPILSRINNHQRPLLRPSRPITNVNQFKKSYLKLDSKLSKCAIPKDYFKSTSTIEQNQNDIIRPKSYISEQVLIKQENSRQQYALMHEMTLLRQQNDLIRIQNQELRKQRSIDLELISRQNQIMQKQQQLMIVSKEQKYRNDRVNMIETDAQQTYTFSNKYPTSKRKLFQSFEQVCQQCRKRQSTRNVEKQFEDARIQKLEEEKKMMKTEIHHLVYECERYKQTLKKLEIKHQKELELNEKLTKLIYNEEKDKKAQQLKKKLEVKAQSINRQPYLKFNNDTHPGYSFNAEVISPKNISRDYLKLNSNYNYQSQPISIKKQSKNSLQFRKIQDQLKQKQLEKANYYKSASNLIKYLEESSPNQQHNYNDHIRQTKFKQVLKETVVKHKIQDNSYDWCQNENIQKYLLEINKQKAREIDQIENLLNDQ